MVTPASRTTVSFAGFWKLDKYAMFSFAILPCQAAWQVFLISLKSSSLCRAQMSHFILCMNTCSDYKTFNDLPILFEQIMFEFSLKSFASW